MPEQDQKVCALAVKFCCGGAASGKISETTDFNISTSQTHYVHDKHEEIKTKKGTSPANQCIKYIRIKSEKGEI